MHGTYSNAGIDIQQLAELPQDGRLDSVIYKTLFDRLSCPSLLALGQYPRRTFGHGRHVTPEGISDRAALPLIDRFSEGLQQSGIMSPELTRPSAPAIWS